jgi:hypothetical protein
MDLHQLFATNLRRLRHAKKLSQEQLAYDAGVDRAYLSRVERAVTYVGLEIIENWPPSLRSIRPSSSGGPPGLGVPQEGRLAPLPTPSVSWAGLDPICPSPGISVYGRPSWKTGGSGWTSIGGNYWGPWPAGGLTDFAGADWISRLADEIEVPAAQRWHPFTRSLLDRASRAGSRPDRLCVERTIRELADAQGRAEPPVIKWMDTPADAFDHLSRLGLDALLDMGSASFWRRAQPPVSHDEETFDRAFEVRMLANELLDVDGHDRLLMAPKLHAKSRAVSANASDGEVFRVRAVSSQIGWLETSMADVAAQSVFNVEPLLGTGSPNDRWR